jgi:5-methylcytosine-specific restriction endonuclease McrA
MSERKKPWTWWRTKAAAFARDGHRCVYCGTDKGPFEGDHYVPLSAGGSWDISNIVTACPPCNHAKGALMPETWNKMRGAA